MHFLPQNNVLSDDEIVYVVEVAASLGITKLRFTGGEPLIRPNLEELISRTARIAGIKDIALSTNGIMLPNRADALKAAGVTRVNISMDSFRAHRFAEITRGGRLDAVQAAIEASRRVGFAPIKLNVVLMKDVNDDEISEFLKLTYDHDMFVRFIEYMPIGHADAFWKARYLPLDVVLDTARTMAGAETLPMDNQIQGNGPAVYYQLPGAKGAFGLIHPVSDHFCASCNRLRLTADGNFKACLFWDDEYSVRPYIGDYDGMVALLQRVLQSKPESHQMGKLLTDESLSQEATVRRMSQIGG